MKKKKEDGKVKSRVKVKMKTGTLVILDEKTKEKRNLCKPRRGKTGAYIFDDNEDFPYSAVSMYVPEGWLTVQKGY